MTRIAILGAAGRLGQHVTREALAAGHTVTAVLRRPEKLPVALRTRVQLVVADIAGCPVPRLAELLGSHDALIHCAGYVSEGSRFNALVGHVVQALQGVPAAHRPHAWFMGGAAVLDLDRRGRRGVQLPVVRKTYWPHAANLALLEASGIAWNLLCPGPLSDAPAIGTDHLRHTDGAFPAPLPAWAAHVPTPMLLPLFARRIPQVIVPFADAAAFLVAHATGAGLPPQRRIGLALPMGMKGQKARWSAQAPATSANAKLA